MKFIEEEVIAIQEQTTDLNKRGYLYSALFNNNKDTLTNYDLNYLIEIMCDNALKSLEQSKLL